MSTYYSIICDDCKEITDAASRTAGGYCHVGTSEETLIPFIIAHTHHKVRFLTKHDYETEPGYTYERKFDHPDFNKEFVKWTEENVEAMVQQAKNNKSWFK